MVKLDYLAGFTGRGGIDCHKPISTNASYMGAQPAAKVWQGQSRWNRAPVNNDEVIAATGHLCAAQTHRGVIAKCFSSFLTP